MRARNSTRAAQEPGPLRSAQLDCAVSTCCVSAASTFAAVAAAARRVSSSRMGVARKTRPGHRRLIRDVREQKKERQGAAPAARMVAAMGVIRAIAGNEQPAR